MDPLNDVDDAPLQLQADRYARMDAYFATIGRAGARMMRQTAAIQVNVDPGDVERTWRTLNAAAPYLTALFANSPRRAGLERRVASARALAWRELDPLRTGVMPCVGDAADEYAGFALWAPAMFRRDEAGQYLRFCDWAARGEVDDAFLDTHLTTLFPEVRPKGYFEVRAIDALPPERYAAPVLLLAGITQDPAALHAAAELLGAPRPALLDTAAREGLHDAHVRMVAAELFDIALDGCRRLGTDVCGDVWLEDAVRYRERAFAVRALPQP
jgi:glutamate--cysteine ligase